MRTANVTPSPDMSKALHAPEAEIAVLGACLIDPEAILAARKLIAPESFAVARHRVVFRAMLRAVDAGRAIDPVTLAEDLSARGELEDAGGLPYLAELLDTVPSAANVEDHARIVADRAARRTFQDAARRILADAADPDLTISEIRARIDQYADKLANLDSVDGLPLALPVAEIPPPDPIPWAVRGLILAADLNLLVSDGGVGKTTLATAIAAAKAVGRPAFGFGQFRTTAGPVLYVSEEDPADVILNRLNALAAGHRWDAGAIGRRVHVLAQGGVCLDAPEWQAHLSAEAKRIGAELIVFDPYAELTMAEENSNDAAKPVIRYLRRLAVETGAGVVIVHHAGKAGEGRRKVDRIRGASALHAAARSALFLELDELGIRVEAIKMNRGPKPAPFVVSRTVQSDPENPAEWLTARLEYLTAHEADEDRAERFVLDHLGRGTTLNTSELKELARGTGVSGAEVSYAIKRLETTGRIKYTPGHRGAKQWYIPTLPNESGQGGQGTLPRLPKVAGQGRNSPPEVAPLFIGGNQGRVREITGQAEWETHPADLLDEEEAA